MFFAPLQLAKTGSLLCNKRTNARLKLALDGYPIEDWTLQLATRQHKVAQKLAQRGPHGQQERSDGIRWDPRVPDIQSPNVAPRSPGRPRRKWDDYLRMFVAENFPLSATWVQCASMIDTWILKLQLFNNCFLQLVNTI